MLILDYKPIPDLTPVEVERLRTIAAPYYEDVNPVFNRDLKHCTHIYLVKETDTIVGFFMIAWEHFILNDQPQASLFLGLAAVHTGCRDENIASIAFTQSGFDTDAWVQRHQKPLCIWCTTATPIVLKFVPKFWTLVAPEADGTYSSRYVSVANAIRQTYFNHGGPSDHPFVLKGVATGTRYSEPEQVYLTDVTQRTNITTFEQLGIDERNGDRLLMIMDRPDAEKLTKIRAKQEQLLNTSIV